MGGPNASFPGRNHPSQCIRTYSENRKDLALARTQRGLERRIKNEGAEAGLKAQVKYWVGAWEVEEVFAMH